MKKHLKFLFLWIICCIFALNLCACGKKEFPDTTQNVGAGTVKILHAGGGIDGLTLLNCQEPFSYYYEFGYRYFEYDLQLSTDGRLIGTHSFEHLNVDKTQFTYEEFKALRTENGLTPVNEEWLMQTIMRYPDVQIVVDSKMPTIEEDVLVLKRIEELESVYQTDVSSNIIPEIFSKEMWEEAQKCTTFDRYFFSHYKVYYSIGMMLEYFSSPKIYAIAVPVWSDSYIRENLYQLKDAGKKIFVFTVTDDEQMQIAQSLNADGIYIDAIKK